MTTRGAILFKREVFQMIGGYFQYRVSCDSGFLRMCKKNDINIIVVDNYLYIYRKHNNPDRPKPGLAW